MATQALALATGGTDSLLAIHLAREQGVKVRALRFTTLFACGHPRDPVQDLEAVGVPLETYGLEEDQARMCRRRRAVLDRRKIHPCLECHLMMLSRAAERGDDPGQIVITGEVVGQRRETQRKRDLLFLARKSRLEHRLVRPLSARLLPETRAEADGLLDRSRLLGLSTSRRAEQHRLAAERGLPRIEARTSGCRLLDAGYVARLDELLAHDPDARRDDIELLSIGRHHRMPDGAKLIVARDGGEGARLVAMFERRAINFRGTIETAIIEPIDFKGPTAMLVPMRSRAAADAAAGLVAGLAKIDSRAAAHVGVRTRGDAFVTLASPCDVATLAKLV